MNRCTMKDALLLHKNAILVSFLAILVGVACKSSSTFEKCSKEVSAIAEKAMPSIVYISFNMKHNIDSMAGFSGIPPRCAYVKMCQSGFLIANNGLILSKGISHDINDSDISVRLSNDSVYSAKLVYNDSQSLVSLLRIDRSGLPFLGIGSSKHASIGEFVLSIGYLDVVNPLVSVSTGTICANETVNIGQMERGHFIVVDLNIFPMSFGGPILNATGDVIGIGVMRYEGQGHARSLALVLPIDETQQIVNEIMARR